MTVRREWCIAPRVFTPADVSVRAAELERVFKQAGVTVAILFGSLAAPTSEGGDLGLAVDGVGDRVEDPPVLDETLCRLFRADNIDLVSSKSKGGSSWGGRAEVWYHESVALTPGEVG